mgnify:FL=1
MMLSRRIAAAALCILFTLPLFLACSPAAEPAVATPEPTQATATPAPTATPVPSPTPFPEPTPFTVAWMTDTQEYAANHNDIFCAMTQWIADTQKEYNTVLTVHTGDMIRGSYREYQWQNMVQAFSLLPKDMQILTVGGNHDIASFMPDYTPYLAYRPDTDTDAEHSIFDGNVYYIEFEAGDVNILVFSITYGYEVESQDWINAVCAEHSNSYAILCLHSYLEPAGYSSGGRYLFDGVVKKSPNVRLVLCGHEPGVRYQPEELDDDGDGVADRTVQQMLFNMQEETKDGEGFLRLLQFDTVNDTINVITYSPHLDVYGYDWPGGDHFGGEHLIENAGIAQYRMHPDTSPANWNEEIWPDNQGYISNESKSEG